VSALEPWVIPKRTTPATSFHTSNGKLAYRTRLSRWHDHQTSWQAWAEQVLGAHSMSHALPPSTGCHNNLHGTCHTGIHMCAAVPESLHNNGSKGPSDRRDHGLRFLVGTRKTAR
jgi:hypothetical protein